MVVGIDTRNRDFSVSAMLAALRDVEAASGQAPVLVYLDCDATTLVQRYSATRRRHPLSPHESPLIGIERELALLAPLRERADVLIDTRGDDAASALRRDGPAVRRGGGARAPGGDAAVLLLQARECRAAPTW